MVQWLTRLHGKLDLDLVACEEPTERRALEDTSVGCGAGFIPRRRT